MHTHTQTSTSEQNLPPASSVLHLHPSLSAAVQQLPEEVRQETNIDEALVFIEADDSSLRHLNLNNHNDLTPDVFTRLFEALADNTRLRKLELANVKLGDSEARVKSIEAGNTM